MGEMQGDATVIFIEYLPYVSRRAPKPRRITLRLGLHFPCQEPKTEQRGHFPNEQGHLR